MSETNIDRACEIEQLMLEQALADQKRKAVYLKPTGFCKNCGEVIPPDAENQRFCDIHCRDDYDLEMKRLARG